MAAMLDPDRHDPTHPDLAAVAALIGDPTRATMLVELMCGRALTATELASRADIAPSTASDHLARLVMGGLLTRVAQGRHRYYQLASPSVARVLEALGVLAVPGMGTRPGGRPEPELVQGARFARTCYDHLAGRLGVAVTSALVARRMLRSDPEGYRLTPAGDAWLRAFGVDVATARRARRAFARRCLDWSERRPHLAGALGAALLARLVEVGWIERMDGERAVLLTPDGHDGLLAELGVQLRDGAPVPS